MKHPATLPDRQIGQPPLPNATTSRYDKLPKNSAATAAYLNYRLQKGDRAGAGDDLRTAMQKAPDRVEPVIAAANVAMNDETETGLSLSELTAHLVQLIQDHLIRLKSQCCGHPCCRPSDK